MIDPRGGVEQLHRIGDAVTLAIADNRDARTVRGLSPIEPGEARREESGAPGPDYLFVDLRNHACEAP